MLVTVIGPMLEPEASNSHHGPKFQSRYLGCFRLLHPDLGELSKPFHDLYSDEKLLNVVCDILLIEKTDLSMELLNMLINPLTDFELDWHRIPSNQKLPRRRS